MSVLTGSCWRLCERAWCGLHQCIELSLNKQHMVRGEGSRTKDRERKHLKQKAARSRGQAHHNNSTWETVDMSRMMTGIQSQNEDDCTVNKRILPVDVFKMLSDRTGKASKNLTENETSSGILPVGEACWIWLEGARFVKEYILTSIYFRICMRDRKPFTHTQVNYSKL